MNRTKQKQIRFAMQGKSKSEIRRVRRGRELGEHAGEGHGKRTYKPVMTSETRKAERSIRRATSKIITSLLGGKHE